MEESLVDALALRALPGLGDRYYKVLVDSYGCASRALYAGATGRISGVENAARLAGILAEKPDRAKAASELAKVREMGLWAVSYGEPLYPPLLASIHDPPSILYGTGDVRCLDSFAVAMVGSRKSTPHGMGAARKLA